MAKGKTSTKGGTTTGLASGYGTRSVWRWVIFYMVLALVIYGFIAYLVK